MPRRRSSKKNTNHSFLDSGEGIGGGSDSYPRSRIISRQTIIKRKGIKEGRSRRCEKTFRIVCNYDRNTTYTSCILGLILKNPEDRAQVRQEGAGLKWFARLAFYNGNIGPEQEGGGDWGKKKTTNEDKLNFRFLRRNRKKVQ